MKYKKKILNNGLRIITVPMKDNPTVTTLVLVEAGSKYETREISGISHFLEHMCFKGTKKRPNPGDISHELDALGAQSNAFTSQEFTGYYAKAHSKNVHKLIDIISDLYLNPDFKEEEIEKEKGVIIEEINMYNDLPTRNIYDIFMELLYGDQPAGWNIAGGKEIIKKIKKQDFVKYREKNYVASATTVVVAGNFDEKTVIKGIEKNFADISTAPKNKKQKVKELQIRPQLKIKNKKSDQTHLIIGVRAYDFFKDDSITTSVIAGILGKGMSSRLFHKLREEMGVCYYVRAENNTFSDHGFFNVVAGVDNKRVREVVKAILDEFKKLKSHLVSDEELKKVKEYMIGNLFLGLESSDAYAEFYGIQEILNKPIKDAKEKAKKIKSVSEDDIRRVANKIFKNENLNLAIIGTIKKDDEKEIAKILRV